MSFRSGVLILFLLVFAAYPSFCQESMMEDVSYPFLEKLITTAKMNYPKVKTYDHKLTIAKLDLKKARLDWWNIISFIYLYSPSGTQTSSGVVSQSVLSGFQAGFSLSIGTILQKPGMVKAAREQYAIAKLDQDEYSLNIETMVKQRYFLYVQQKTILNWKTKDMQSAGNIANDMQHKFEKGEVTFESYNASRNTYSSTIQGKIQAEGAYLVAKSNLEELLGVKLESIQ
jgi:outer membrane protein TolC